MSTTNSEKSNHVSNVEQFRIYFSDDAKIKSFGEILTSDAGRIILKSLLSDELTANQISQKSGISLQLVKYHLNKMQDLGIVSVSKTEKNSKAHDMKFYTATKFAIMILPQSESEKVRQSLVQSLRKFSKITAVMLATAGALLGTHLSQSMMTVKDIPQSVGRVGNLVDPRGIEETLRLARMRVDVAQSGSGFGSGTPMVSADMFWIQVVAFGTIMAGLSAILFWKAKNHSQRLARLE